MRKIVFLLFLLVCGGFIHAQEKTISGTIVSADDNAPLQSVTITNTKTNKRTQTDGQGYFQLKASVGDKLVFSAVGYSKKEVTVSNDAVVNLSLTVVNKELGEVVVTALGIKRDKRGLGFASQEIKGEEVSQTQRENFFNSLQGRVAGATLVQTSGAPGASSNIVLRGFNSLSGNNSPLIVVDGLPISNNTFNQGLLASDLPNRNNDYTNRAADINPDDIESINILKGPEATALYGIEAGSGAIIITTKKAKAGKLKISYDNNFRLTHLYRFPEIQTVYGTGLNGVSSKDRRLFGPKNDAGTPFYDNIRNFFRDGFQHKHNLTLEGGKKNTALRGNLTYRDESGVVPNTGLNQIQARVTVNQKVTKKLDVNFSAAYINTRNDKSLRGSGGFLQNLMLWPTSDDARDYLNPNGTRKFFFEPDATGNQPNEADNPFFETAKNISYDKTNRGLLNLTVNYRPTSWWDVVVRVGSDIYDQEGLTYFHPESNQARTVRGQVEDYTEKFRSINGVLINTFKKSFGKFNGTVRVGIANDDWVRKNFSRRGQTLKDSVTKDISAATALVTSRETGRDTLTKKRLQGVFGEISVNYDELVYLTLTGRNDWTSTLPTASRSFFYPAVSLSVIMSDLVFKNVKSAPYWKLRASYAQTAKDILPYGSQSWYTNAPGTTNAYGFAYDFFNQNPKIVPETQKTFELGTELKLFNNRISLDYTYYNTRNLDQIVRLVRLSYGTGFILNTSNISDTKNTGHEIMLGLVPVKNKVVTWRVNLNFNTMTNKVTRIPDNIPEFYNSDTWLGNFRAGLTRNGTITQLTGQDYLKNTAGQILIDPSTGYPLPDPNYTKIADRNPDFQLGIGNTITYKKISLSFLLDIKKGGDILNGNEIWMTQNGISTRTLDREQARVYNGVLRDGLENTATPTKNTISVIPMYQSAVYTDRTYAVDYVEHDVNWVRLRDITLRLSAGNNLLKKLKLFTAADAFVTATDVFIITNYTGVDPSAAGNSAATLGNGSFGIDFGSLSIPRGINFGLRVQFKNK